MLFLSAVLLTMAPQGPSLIAFVDDPMSHGTVGDARLSLDEAIRLANGSLAIASLSPAEKARLSGASGIVETARVDATATPTITLEAPFTDVAGQGNGVLIEGLANPIGRRPEIL